MCLVSQSRGRILSLKLENMVSGISFKMYGLSSGLQNYKSAM